MTHRLPMPSHLDRSWHCGEDSKEYQLCLLLRGQLQFLDWVWGWNLTVWVFVCVEIWMFERAWDWHTRVYWKSRGHRGLHKCLQISIGKQPRLLERVHSLHSLHSALTEMEQNASAVQLIVSNRSEWPSFCIWGALLLLLISAVFFVWFSWPLSA